MLCYVNITSPKEMFMRVVWPDGVPYPAVGDEVLFRQHDVTWVFKVESRLIGIGFDPVTKQPAANVALRVDSATPEGWRPERCC